MRGADTFTESLFTMRHLDDFVPADHPLRVIRFMVNKALANMDELFAQMYAADIKATLNKPSKISAQTWMTQFFGLLCLSRGPFGQFAGR